MDENELKSRSGRRMMNAIYKEVLGDVTLMKHSTLEMMADDDDF